MTSEERARAWGPWALLLGVLILLPGAWLAAFHCDEANVFRFVTRFGYGDYRSPGRPGLLWLLLTPSLEFGVVGSAIAMRMAAAAASIVTLWAVWRLGTRAGGAAAGTWAVFLLGTSMSWQPHAFEVRTDTFVLPVTLLGMMLLWRAESRVREAVLIGLLVAAAGLFSQKSIYNAAAMGAGWLVLWWFKHIPRRLGMAIVASAVALGCVAAWYGFLAWATSQGEVVGSNLSAAASNAFENPRPVSTNFYAWGLAGNRAPLMYAGLVPGAVAAWKGRKENGQLLAMAAASLVMASTVFFHRGFFMYFIASFEPYLAVCSGAGWVALFRWLPGRFRGLVAVGIGVATVVVAAWYYPAVVTTTNRGQLELMREVEAAFPDPTPYWDSVGLVPLYPETTKFLTRANRESMRKKMGKGALIQLARERKPLMFIRDYITRERYLEQDESVWIWSHYVPYRSNLYLRGGRVQVRARERQATTVEVVAAGEYTVHFWGGWTGEATVGGEAVRHREVITLEEGDVELVADAASGSGQLWLLIGAHRQPYVETIDEVVDLSLYPLLTRKRYQQYDKPGKEADLLTQVGDPVLRSMGESELVRRREAHRVWQQMHDARMARLQQGEEAGAGGVIELSPEEREDRAMRALDELSPEERETRAMQ